MEYHTKLEFKIFDELGIPSNVYDLGTVVHRYLLLLYILQ